VEAIFYQYNAQIINRYKSLCPIVPLDGAIK
jgi:hypothetical protein